MQIKRAGEIIPPFCFVEHVPITTEQEKNNGEHACEPSQPHMAAISSQSSPPTGHSGRETLYYLAAEPQQDRI